MKKILVMLLWAPATWVCASSIDSLSAYQDIALRENPQILEKFYEYEASLQKVAQAKSLPDPELNLGVLLKPMEVIGGEQVAEINLMQMFPWFGVLKNAQDEMSLMAKAKFATFENEKLQVQFDVRSVGIDLVENGLKKRILQKSIELLQTMERLGYARLRSGSSTNGMNAEAGSSTLSGIYQIQLEIAEMNYDLVEMENERQVLASKLNNMLNRNLSTPLFLSDELSKDSLDPSFLVVHDSIFTQHPMTTMLVMEEKSLEAKGKMQKQMGMPMVGVGLSYTILQKNPMSTSPMNGQDMFMPMVRVSVPIYRKKYQAQIKENQYLRAATNEKYQATRNNLKQMHFEAVQMYIDAQRRIKLFENQLVVTEKMLELTTRNFSTSTSTLTELLELQEKQLIYERKKVEALADFNRSKYMIYRLLLL